MSELGRVLTFKKLFEVKKKQTLVSNIKKTCWEKEEKYKK